jgi:hypothetical protein
MEEEKVSEGEEEEREDSEAEKLMEASTRYRNQCY